MRPLPAIKEAQNLVSIHDEDQEFQLEPQTAKAWLEIKAAARAAQVDLRIVSAFRSIRRQAAIIAAKQERGITDPEIYRVNAPAGYSEHHSGRAIDIGTEGSPPLDASFESTPAFQWLQTHAAQYGFRLSYPRDNQYGIIYEPWHWCYYSDTV
ncbi:MAG: M15 family metallopeptidase [Verrucomicrobiota bacterium]